MIGLRREEEQRREFERLSEMLLMLVGAKFLGSAWSYGDELQLDISGADHRKRGTVLKDWTVGTRASRWILLSPTRVVAHDRDVKDPHLEVFEALEGTAVRSAEARFEDYALTVAFSNDYRFVVLPNKRRRMKAPDLAVWCLYAPLGIVVDVQPNGDVDFIPGDVVDDVAYVRKMRGR